MSSETWQDLRALMPEAVVQALLPWEWSRELLWKLDLPTQWVDVRVLAHVLEVTLWRGKDGTPFAVRPADVLEAPERYPMHAERLLAADLAYPLHITKRRGTWIVVDGVHRLARAVQLGRTHVAVCVVSEERYQDFALRPGVVTAAPG